MYIDLSVPLNEQTPVYPGDPSTKIEPAGVIEKDGFTDHYVSIGTHVGTHIDAPLHMIANERSLNQFPIDSFIGRGRYVKVENNVFDIESVKKAGIEPGDIVIFHTGMDSQYRSPTYFEEYPAIPEDVAKYLVQSKVKMVGMDMCSPDHEPYPIHKILLGSGVLIIENLTNLAQLAEKAFTIYALPVSLELDAAPARVIAQLNL